jgi:hypothetical protein
MAHFKLTNQFTPERKERKKVEPGMEHMPSV